MSEYVKVKKSELDNLIGAAVDALNFLDDIRGYLTQRYEDLGEALEITWEEIE